jgi:hypothetical protein
MARRKGGGSTLKRTEVIQVRLDPRLRYAAEVAARQHRTTLSSYIERAVAKAVNAETVYPASVMDEPIPLEEIVHRTWDVAEADRFVLFANLCPALLNIEEQQIWKEIRERPELWKDHQARPATGPQKAPLDTEQFDFQKLRKEWQSLRASVEDIDARIRKMLGRKIVRPAERKKTEAGKTKG